MEKNIILFFANFTFFLMPWYYLHSGLPQPVDMVILLLFTSLLLLKFPFLKLIHLSPLFRLFIAYSVYAIIALLMNYIVNSTDVTLYLIGQNIYYIVLSAIFLSILTIIHQNYPAEKCYQLILMTVLISCLLPILYWLTHMSAHTRISLTFNNPNQLGFFALVNISMIYYVGLVAGENDIRINKMLALVIINLNLLFLFLSASRSCYPVILLYIFAYFIIFNVKLRGEKLWLFRVVSGSLAAIFLVVLFYELFSYMKSTRISNLPTSYTSLFYDFYFRAIRGIDFSTMKTWNLLLGNGTHTTAIRGNLEFHNNFVGIFNQIGLLGLLFYLYFNFEILKALAKKGWIYLVPYFCYLFFSMFQYSYRTRLNWLFLSIIIFVTLIHYSENKKTTLLQGRL